MNEQAEEESKAFQRIVSAFQQYEIYQAQWLKSKQKMYHLPQEDLQRICDPESALTGVELVVNHLQGIKKRVHENQQFLNTVTLPYEDLFPNQILLNPPTTNAPARITAYHDEMEKLKSTLRQIAREWSVHGTAERDQCFKPLLDELEERFPDPNTRSKVKVLNPGCGLGRLAWEIARRGFISQGNEFSFFMLLTSNAILNKSPAVEATTIYPWIHSFCNLNKAKHQLKECKFPDELPVLSPDSDFSMGAGDFLEIYNEPNSWNCVVTSFFIDTAHNVIEYIRCINKILVPGGVWINLGPLLYHWADMPGEESVELTLEQILNVIKSFGMEVQKRSTHECIYTGNPKSMMNLVYSAEFFVAVKPSK